MLEPIFFIKLFVAIGVVIGLSILAERVSPKIAGILSGYPTGSAITLFFFGLEMSPQFASESAIYNMIGLSAMMTFIYCYYLASKHFTKYNILLSSLSGILGYVIVIYGLHFVELNKFIAMIIPIISAFIFIYLFKNIKDHKIKNKVKLNHKTLLIRAIFAASIILLITGIPQIVGSTRSGLFSSFPTTLFPLMLIVHYTYDQKHVHTIIKNVPIGIFSLILYSLTISIVYSQYGIYRGTIIGFLVATIYLILYKKIKNYIN